RNRPAKRRNWPAKRRNRPWSAGEQHARGPYHRARGPYHSAGLRLDQVRAAFTHHHHRDVRVGGGDLRHRRGIHDAKPLYTLDAQLWIQWRVRVLGGTHAHGTHRVVHRVVRAHDVVLQLGVTLRLGARVQLPAGPLRHRRLRDDLAGLADPGDHHLHVGPPGVGDVA